MFQRTSFFSLLLLLAAASALPNMVYAASGKSTTASKVEGRLTGVASNGVIIKTASGVFVSVGVTSSTKVELNGAHVSVTSLPIGARAQAVFDATTSVASKVEARN